MLRVAATWRKRGEWDVGGKGDIRDINDGSRRYVGGNEV